MSPITQNLARVMPDIANEARPAVAGRLDWVGMGEIELAVSAARREGAAHASGARVNAFVNLNRPDVRGIHMSRLYLHVDKRARAPSRCRPAACAAC